MKRILISILIATSILSLSSCGSVISEESEKKVDQVQVWEESEKEVNQEVQVGDIITSQDWEVELTDAYSSITLESEESSTSWTAYDGYAFAILEFDIECLNSTKPTIDGSGITNLIAKVNGNTYTSWTYQYINSELWLYADNTYLDAHLPLHIYVYTCIPADSIYDKIDVELTIAGEECHITIN